MSKVKLLDLFEKQNTNEIYEKVYYSDIHGYYVIIGLFEFHPDDFYLEDGIWKKIGDNFFKPRTEIISELSSKIIKNQIKNEFIRRVKVKTKKYRALHDYEYIRNTDSYFNGKKYIANSEYTGMMAGNSGLNFVRSIHLVGC